MPVRAWVRMPRGHPQYSLGVASKYLQTGAAEDWAGSIHLADPVHENPAARISPGSPGSRRGMGRASVSPAI